MHMLYTVEFARPQANFDYFVKHCTSIIKISMLIRPCTDICYCDTKTTKIHIFLHSSPSLTCFFLKFFIYLCLNSHHFICDKEHTFKFSGT